VLSDAEWFAERLDAAREALEFLAGDGLGIEGRRVADIGSRDGITDVGLAVEGGPAEIVGFDHDLTDESHLRSLAREAGYADELPASLRFDRSSPDRIPAEDAAFDVVVSWSAFEGASDPLGVVEEIRRVIRPQGVLFLQVWPFPLSEQGARWRVAAPAGEARVIRSTAEIGRRLGDPAGPRRTRAPHGAPPPSGLTLDVLGAALFDGGFYPAKVEVISAPVQFRSDAPELALSERLVSGVKLLAAPRPL
jgi:SAM-dependent methyltransferase